MSARFGIDFGTTNTVVAWADRGNYPVLPLASGGEERLATPSILAWRDDGEVRSGTAALEAWDEPGWRVLPSPKRWLGVPEPEPLAGEPEGPGAAIERVVTAAFAALREEIERSPHLEAEDELEAVLGIPANANSLQRLRTLRAARDAGFRVLGLLHEPTAAAIEYAARHPGFGRVRGGVVRHVAVYDLGGGTFDAAVVACAPDGFEVLRSGGVERLGGDDFDLAMAELALAKSGSSWDAIGWPERHRLLEICRDAKEGLRGTTKKWLVDVGAAVPGADEAALYMDEYAAACAPLVERSVSALTAVLEASAVDAEEIDALLLVGGASQMPLVRRRLKDLFGTRLKLSPHPFAATAVGLAIHADTAAESPVGERFSRHFGVWREGEEGRRPVFDPIFDPATRIPLPGEHLVVTRRYRPMHDVGHFRFAECAELDAQGRPREATPWCEIRFPFDPNIAANATLEARDVRRTDAFGALEVEERYEVDDSGTITVRIARSDPPLARSYLLYGPERVQSRR